MIDTDSAGHLSDISQQAYCQGSDSSLRTVHHGTNRFATRSPLRNYWHWFWASQYRDRWCDPRKAGYPVHNQGNWLVHVYLIDMPDAVIFRIQEQNFWTRFSSSRRIPTLDGTQGCYCQTPACKSGQLPPVLFDTRTANNQHFTVF